MLFKKKIKEEYNFDKDLGPPLEQNKDSEGLFKQTPIEEESNFSNFNSSTGINNMPDSVNSLHEHGTSPQPQTIQTPQNNNNTIDSKEFQIMNSKLDAIKSELDALMQHILKIERTLDEKKKKPLW